MQALIVDDEEKARDVLELLIRHHVPDISEIRLAGSGKAANAILSDYRPDLVFLDIKMPGQDGFQWLRSLKSRDFDVIFTTAYDQYAIMAIRFSAFDYLLKPVDIEDLQAAVRRYNQARNHREASYDTLFHNTRQSNPEDYRLTITTTEGSHFLRPKDIVRCEADGNYTHFYIHEGRHIMASRSLGYFTGLLPENTFIRCHKSHLVNRHFIESLAARQLNLKTGTVVEVSRRRLPAVKEAMINHRLLD